MPAPQKPKAGQRTPEQITRDLATERAGLEKAFAGLRDDLTEATDTITRKATQVGVIGTVAVAGVAAGVGALVGSAVAVRGVLRHRRRRRED
ncbi:MAG TPA: hypothetical protein VK576_10120 [Thermoleophilia bacterium]|nr:hypothetical protein [Thermoleophilia bacterium]